MGVAAPGDRMQELVLVQPQGTAKAMQARDADETRLAFEAFLPESGPLAFRIARSVLRNDADAEDVAQESLLRAYRKLDRLRDRTRFRAWLVRITYRLALDRARARKRSQEREALWVRETARSSVAPGAGGDFQAQLEKAVEELPEKLRIVLLLAAMEGHTMEEIAALLDVPPGTVKSRLFFARKKVAEKLRCFVKPTGKP